jgi:RNA polymerase sigma factor (sigma-70 family)
MYEELASDGSTRMVGTLEDIQNQYKLKQRSRDTSNSKVDDEFISDMWSVMDRAGNLLIQLIPFVITSIVEGTVLEQAQEMINDGTPRKQSTPAEGGNLLAILIDIKKAYLKLGQEDKTILQMRYHDNYTLQQIAQYLECATSTADRRSTSALRRLQDRLGGKSPWN